MLSGLLPNSLVDIFLDHIKMDKTRKCKTLNDKEIEGIAFALKNFKLQYKCLDKLDFGIITSGGVNVNEINPKTMESKLIKGLFFAGEIIDVDALTGGFNLQIAFSTAFLAGRVGK